ncbi:ATP-dependent helicase [Arcanobacterium hippocoleae]|uniref:DNA 3'-5' helicase n=1 Tax=Arcanobacterium hippocoleae TaxID=149017 RepID=A0ABU1T137_9ACTO|nr:UvrD-helicase domain-containing protein [Arcanobacterium hippocoleae]MDR6939063.1 DNA helicase-2/ATP-dependent DNA helicase PcrA [Arcanobacterium hippocoleae]
MNDKNSLNDPFLETMARLRARVAAAQEQSASGIPAAGQGAVHASGNAAELQQQAAASAGGKISSSQVAGNLGDIAARLRARGGFAGAASVSSERDGNELTAKQAQIAAFSAGEIGAGDPRLAQMLAGLNPRQHEAVVHTGGHLLVVAGAGSGKTRVLTTRISYLIASGQVSAAEILAITFTNKAAKEMRERLVAMLGPVANRMWISTFHSACVRILRAEHEAIGYRSTFTIYDTADSQRLLKIVCAEEGIESKQHSPKILAHRISDLKNEMIPASQALAQATDRDEEIVAKAYAGYQQRLTAANAMDFDDLIFKTVQLFKTNAQVLEKYRRRFRQILVDEYQDTNPAQYELIRILAGEEADLARGQLTVVGDADQSIYAFRGATIRNIESFESDFPSAHTVLLEQNYRSTQNILTAANALISNNAGRRAKNLWTDSGKGAKLVGYVADSERDEAAFVVAEIDQLRKEGFKYGEFAIFYRANAQSRAIEDLLMRAGIPYKVVGGTKFYDRKEIKDAIAYLQAVANPDDTISLRRIFNEPKRGLGAKAESEIALYAQRNGISFGAALAGAVKDDSEIVGISTRARNSLRDFVQLLATAREKSQAGEEPAEILDYLMDESGYLRVLQTSHDPQDDVRVENIAELRAVAADFIAENPEGTLDDFLDQISLVSDTDQIPDDEDHEGEVVLMTVHTAKGLEFPAVFVTGFEEGTFPHVRAMNSIQELSEERRLAYVALTRARKRLYVTRAACRSQWGAPQELPPSRFLEEIPEDVIEWRRIESANRAFGNGWGNGTSSNWGNGGRRYARSQNNEYWSDWDDDGDFAPAYGSGFKAGKLGVDDSAASQKPVRRQDDDTFSDVPESHNANTASAAAGFKIGDKVRHKSFGVGKVIGFEGQGKSAVAKVRFNSGTTKRLMLRFAPLEKISCEN